MGAKAQRCGAVENHQTRGARAGAAPGKFLQTRKRELGLRGDCVGVRLIADGEMARLNEKYRGEEGTTDVLSFPVEERRKPELRGNPKRRHRGEKFWAILRFRPRWRDGMPEDGKRKLPEELQVLILHGVLHLLGYDHEADQARWNAWRCDCGGDMDWLKMETWALVGSVLVLALGLPIILLPGADLPRTGADDHGARSRAPGDF